MVAGFSSGDLEAVLSAFADDIVYEDVPFGVRAEGKAQVEAFCREFMKSLPDFRQELSACHRAGALGFMEWTMSFTQTGDLPGIPATGKPVRVRGATALGLRGDRITHNRSYYDLASVLRQLGMLPALPDE